jgi:hypothetical protein
MLIVLLIVAVIVLGVAASVVWVFARLIQLMGRAVSGSSRTVAIPRASTTGSDPQQRCRNPGCRTANPQHARFCRRCGTTLAAVAGGAPTFARASVAPQPWVDRPKALAQA